MKYTTSKPEGMSSEEYWKDKSQDTMWLRGGFLARGKEIDEMQQRIYRLLAAYSAHEIRIDELMRYKAYWRAAFGLSFGALLVRLFT